MPNQRIRWICLLLLWLISVPLLINGGFEPAWTPAGTWRYPLGAVIISCGVTLAETGWIAWSLAPSRGRCLVRLSAFSVWALALIRIGFSGSDMGGLPTAHARWLLLVLAGGLWSGLVLGLWSIGHGVWQRLHSAS